MAVAGKLSSFASLPRFLLLLWAMCTGQDALEYTMQEELPPGSLVGNIREDMASFLGRTLPGSIILLPGEFQRYFAVDQVYGELTVNTTVDRDVLCPSEETCVLTLNSAWSSTGGALTSVPVQVTVEDVNDNIPEFPRSSETVSISENALTGSSYMLPTAVDPDSHSNGIQSYRLVPDMEMFTLNVDPVAGSLSLVLEHSVDREVQDSYSLQLLAQDGGQPPLSGILDLQIRIVDSNDNVPTFVQRQYNVSLQEDQDPLTPFLQVRATDPDEGLNGEVVYTLAPQTADSYGSLFSLDGLTGELSLRGPLDYQMGNLYRLVVTARDRGQDSQQSYVQVYIYIQDVNNHAPEISVSPVVANTRISVRENQPGGAVVAIVSVTDQDRGESGRCECVVVDDHFSLEPLYTNGFKLATRRPLDRELQDNYLTTVECQDSGNPVLHTQQDVVVAVLDENDHPPVFSHTEYTASIQENTIQASPVLWLNASDPDEGDNARVTYFIEGAEAKKYLILDEESGSIRTKHAFDYEDRAEFLFMVKARDHGNPPLTASATLVINVVDTNDEAPKFTHSSYSFGTFENQPNGTEIGTVTASDQDSHLYDSFTFSIEGSYDILTTFKIDSDLGRIVTRKSLDREAISAYYLTVVARDMHPPYPSASTNVTVYVADRNDNAPTIIFPSRHNNSVEVSMYSPVNYVIGHVLAEDADIGSNAKLYYKLDKLDPGTPFIINPVNGEISVTSSLQDIRAEDINLAILVEDQGSPPLTATATLHVSINRTEEFANKYLPAGPPERPLVELGYHEKIIIILGAVTAILVAILIAAIILVKRRQMRSTKESYKSVVQGVDFPPKLAGGDPGHGPAVFDMPDITADTAEPYGERMCSVRTFRKPPMTDGHYPGMDPIDEVSIEFMQKIFTVINTSRHSHRIFIEMLCHNFGPL